MFLGVSQSTKVSGHHFPRDMAISGGLPPYFQTHPCPYAPCIEYLPTKLRLLWGKMQQHIPAPWSLWDVLKSPTQCNLPAAREVHPHPPHPNNIIHLPCEDERRQWLYSAILTLGTLGFRIQGFRVQCSRQLRRDLSMSKDMQVVKRRGLHSNG